MRTESEKLGIIFFCFGILLSIYLRFMPTISVGFPVTDGGLFYEMAQAVQSNQYKLPAFVEYNGISIPFVYPPLGFYLTAIISDLFNIPLIEVFRWLPALGSVLFSAAIYPLANAILKSPAKAILATIFFILLPRSISWYIMGGGITRVFGQLFLLLTLFSAYSLFTKPEKKYLFLTIAFGSGVVLSHPEAALHTVGLVFALFIFFGRSKRAIMDSVLTGMGILIITFPVMAANIARHGIQPYLNASQTAYQSIFAWLAIFTGSFADEKFVTVISALALLGLVVTWGKRNWLLTVMLLLPGFLDPRSAASISIVAWAMLAAIGFADVIVPGLYYLREGEKFEDEQKSWLGYFLISPTVRVAITALIFYSFFGAVLSNQVFLRVSLTPADRLAMDWVAKNIPEQSRFLVITGQTESFADAVSEWFPALTKSVSVGTVQGYEWQGGNIFGKKIGSYNELQACLSQDGSCLQNWSTGNGESFEYVFLSRENVDENFLVSSLLEADSFSLIHQEDNVYIFKFNQ